MLHPATCPGVARRASLIAVLLAVLPACGCTRAAGPAIAVFSSSDGPPRLAVTGLDESGLRRFAALEPERQNAVLQVWVAQAPPEAPAILGEVTRLGPDLGFAPRYPFQPGLKYRARFDPAALGNQGEPLVREFTIPAPPRDPVVRVAAVYPSADQLPENLLKFYIHFSGPMSRGEGYAHVRLLDEDGQPVASPFLELGEELWNPEMTRFTLFFDPGRIKHGLVPRMELGPALVTGKTYTLVVDATWQDGEGRPLVQTFTKTFRTTRADVRQPDPSRWRITPPAAGSKQHLVVLFDEPLDHAMLQHVLSVSDGDGREVTGKVAISEQERRWSFTPESSWPPGRYFLTVETILEDAAGNSIGRPFEVDLNQRPVPTQPSVVVIPVDVAARK